MTSSWAIMRTNHKMEKATLIPISADIRLPFCAPCSLAQQLTVPPNCDLSLLHPSVTHGISSPIISRHLPRLKVQLQHQLLNEAPPVGPAPSLWAPLLQAHTLVHAAPPTGHTTSLRDLHAGSGRLNALTAGIKTFRRCIPNTSHRASERQTINAYR